ncbi:T9SS type A sorting domain-containing protein [Flavivirga algicola]|uniref:T9SS type A sorting domain-containing protein n=1 Tax=Flavivirga algicola TaxID=2729136 RepID=A0ABX1RSP7_9FLAO|nr:T9SS type A sorting domain-containing protein [Flavivirga algicola]NMH86000.1 T9SS type A sorting domain-containing protein [Flavivirga algicola]
MRNLYLLFFVSLFILNSASFAQVNINVNLNVKHSVENFSEFDRSKFITIHSNQGENEWNGNNFTSDLRDHFLNGYNVYLGRETGRITWQLNQMQQDPARPGYVDPVEIASRGLSYSNLFAANTAWHPYEDRKNLVIAGQLHPFWTGESQRATSQGWKLANATAVGEYMGRYVNEFHGGNSEETPTYVEIINEPAYEALGGKLDYTNSIQEIADFHVEVADAIKVQAPNLKVGGYTTAFPDFEVGDFQRWHNRWKLFMDVAGDKMDFWSIHLYDFPSIRNGQKELRSGSNIEATLDMLEHYSKLSFDVVKPIVISEYGAQMHDYSRDTWSPFRDWLHIKASSSQLMSFLERPETIASAINFIIVKAEWGYDNTLDIPYNHRLMRKENEPSSYTGQWVYSDMVKFYQLWQNVEGTRVDTTSDDLDIQVDAYVKGDKGYIILNNLNFEPTTINLNIFDDANRNINSIFKRHLTLSGNVPVLDEETLTSHISSVELGAESTMILEYTFSDVIQVDKTSDEKKYYATSYLKSISANQDIIFNINNISKEKTYGEAVLRIGVGREHGKSLHPTVKINNQDITVPTDWRGYDQAQRERFFGVLEIPVTFDLLQTNNTIAIQFNDDGGHISSVSMQVFNFSHNIRDIDPATFPSDNYKIKSTSTTCPDKSNGEIEIDTRFRHNYKLNISGNGVDESFDFTNNLKVSDLSAGTYKLIITVEGYPDYNIEFDIEITEPDALDVFSKVDKFSRSVNLKLSGSKVYHIDLNGKIITTSFNEIDLELRNGKNTIKISTDKECQGVHNESVFIQEASLIYPNPTSNEFLLVVPDKMINGTVSIYSDVGSLILSKKILKVNNLIKVRNLPNGIYFITTHKENNDYIFSKLIIKK